MADMIRLTQSMSPAEAVRAFMVNIGVNEVDVTKAEQALVGYISNRVGMTVLHNNEIARQRIAQGIELVLGNALGHINALEPKPEDDEIGANRTYG